MARRSGNMVEWSLLALVILVLGAIFFRQVRVVQGQGELAAVRSTLGALRTALVIDHLQKSIVHPNTALPALQSNPFELLKHTPANYLGEMTPQLARNAAPGNWVFDPECVCVGYLPLYDPWFESPSADPLAWFRVTGAPGPLQMVARERYVWQGQALE